MSTADASELSAVWDRIKDWPPDQRASLARRILETLEDRAAAPAPPRRLPLTGILGMLKTDAPPPTDEEVERILVEERRRKFG